MNLTNITYPEPEIETTEPKPEPKKLSGFRYSPEPEPEFNIAKEIWGAAWPIHVYVFAILFTLMMFYNLNSILGLAYSRKGAIRRKKIFMCTNFMLFFFNFITALHLFINPYESHEHFRIEFPGLLFIFFGLRLPCLTSSFSLILITLIETSKVKLYSRMLQNLWYLLGIVAVHFVVVIVMHFYLVFYPDEFQLIAICQFFYMCFGLLVSSTVIYSYLKVRQQLTHKEEHAVLYRSFRFGKGKSRKKEKESVAEIENGQKQSTGSEKALLIRPRSPFVDRSLARLFKITLLISISGFLYCAAVFYSIYTMLSEADIMVSPKPWLAQQTVSRIAEIGMVIGMSYLVRRNFLPCFSDVREQRSTTISFSTNKPVKN